MFIMAWRLYTPYDVNRTNLHILTARGMSHILTRIGQLWSSRKKFVPASPKPKLQHYESVQHRLQFSGIKKGAKISFHRHFKLKCSNKSNKTENQNSRLTAGFIGLSKTRSWAPFSKASETFRARRDISSSSVSKNGEVYTYEGSLCSH